MSAAAAWLIVNPNAGRKGGLTVNPAGPAEARAALDRHGIPVELHLTERRGHATNLALQAVAAGAEIVIAAGGDGTIHEVAYGLMGTKTALGIMPLGSFVNLARALDVPRDLDAAAEIIRQRRLVEMDVGVVATARGRYVFLEAAGVGLDAGLFAYANQLDAGKWRYLLPAARFLWRYTTQPQRLHIDGVRHSLARVMMVDVAITPYTGAAVPLAPDARIDDRQLDIVVRTATGRLDLIRHAAAMAFGRGLYYPRTFVRRGRRVRIEPTRKRALVHADGEIVGWTPADFELLPGALTVIVGRAAASALIDAAPVDRAGAVQQECRMEPSPSPG